MKNLTLLLTTSLSLFLMGCSTFPLEPTIKENHFRFENFKRDKGADLEYVYLMCYHKKPVSWASPKQYPSGEHNLWVKARISKRDASISQKETVVNFKVTLEPNKSYMLNRKIVDDKISLWIQEVETGIGVSNVITSTLETPPLIDYNLRKKQCESSSI